MRRSYFGTRCSLNDVVVRWYCFIIIYVRYTTNGRPGHLKAADIENGMTRE